MLRSRVRSRVRGLVFAEPLARAADSYLGAYAEWRHLGSGAKPKEWHDHRADLYPFHRHRRAYWAERGVYSREAMFQGCRVLDLCCGDGFYPYHFYASVAGQIDAVDLDPDAIAFAKERHSLPNISYAISDIERDSFPRDNYDVITWDGAIEHFSPEQIEVILNRCADAFGDSGVLHGMTLLVPERSANPWHEREFASAGELIDLLKRVFPYALTFETVYPDRHNIYFRAGFSAVRVQRDQ